MCIADFTGVASGSTLEQRMGQSSLARPSTGLALDHDESPPRVSCPHSPTDRRVHPLLSVSEDFPGGAPGAVCALGNFVRSSQLGDLCPEGLPQVEASVFASPVRGVHVQKPSASCMCTVISLSVIDSASGQISEMTAVPLLEQSVQRANGAVSGGPFDETRVNAVVATLAAELASAFPYLHEIANSRPRGAVAAVLTHLRVAFVHAAARRPDRAVAAMVAASVTACRLPTPPYPSPGRRPDRWPRPTRSARVTRTGR